MKWTLQLHVRSVLSWICSRKTATPAKTGVQKSCSHLDAVPAAVTAAAFAILWLIIYFSLWQAVFSGEYIGVRTHSHGQNPMILIIIINVYYCRSSFVFCSPFCLQIQSVLG